jgi:hypothetical protein
MVMTLGNLRADIHSSMSLHGPPPDITLFTSILAQQKNARKRLFTSNPRATPARSADTHAEAGGPCGVKSSLLQFVALNRLGRDRPRKGPTARSYVPFNRAIFTSLV